MPIRRADDNQYTLLIGGNSTGGAVAIKGGEYLLTCDGTASGATLSLQVQAPSGTWSDVQIFSGSKVSSTTLPFSQTGIDLPSILVRIAMTGGTPSGITAYLIGLG